MPDSPLWCDNDQAARLAELTAHSSDPAKELPLRRDVRSLGILLGRVLVEQEGEAFFGVVVQLRRLLIQHREQVPSLVPAGVGSSAARGGKPEPPDLTEDNFMRQARETIGRLPLEDAYRLTKAFAIYFELTNLAETNHRKRRRRAARLGAAN